MTTTAPVEPEVSEYISGNVALVAWLSICGHEPTDIIPRRQTGRRGRPHFDWVFNNTDALQESVRCFMAGEARVEPNGYSTLIQELFNELKEAIADSRHS